MSEPQEKIPLIRTKFYLPKEASSLTARKRLFDALQRGIEVPLALVSAPPGYGKTVLVADWARTQTMPVAWLSLDAAEGDLQRFFGYLLAAIHSAAPDIVEQSAQPLLMLGEVSVEQLVLALSDDLEDFASPLVMVLDDYHLISHDSPVHEFISWFLQHPLQNLHWVLVTRHDPPLPLASMRARNQLLEIRQKDLRFSLQETTATLERFTDQAFSTSSVRNLHEQVEGWPAGLRMVVLAMQGSSDKEGFLGSLSGGISHVRDYLAQEVIGRLDADVLGLLLGSAVPQRFCVELVEAVAGASSERPGEAPSAREFVQFARDNNLFVSMIDESGKWFRYHHLFRELLLEEANTRYGVAGVQSMYLRASAWFDSQNAVGEAIEQALLGGDEECAVALVKQHSASEIDGDRWYVVRAWLQLLPLATRQQRPGLLLADAWVAYFSFDIARLGAIIMRLDVLEEAQRLTPDQCSELDYFHSMIAFWDGKRRLCLDYAERAVAVHRSHGVKSGEMQVFLAFGRQICGDVALACEALQREEFAAADAPGSYRSRIAAAQSVVSYLELDTAAALRCARKLSFIAATNPSSYTQAWGAYLEALVYYNTGQFSDACSAFGKLMKASNFVEKRMVLDALLGEALSLQLLGNGGGVDRVERDIVELTRKLQDPEYAELAASGSARLALLRGEVERAAELVAYLTARPKPENLFIWLEEPVVTVARVRLARGRPEDISLALDDLEQLRSKIAAHHLECRAVDVMALQSLAWEKRGNRTLALQLMAEALALAAPANWIRPFLELGQALVPLLKALDAEEPTQKFVQLVLATLAANLQQGALDPAADRLVANEAQQVMLTIGLTNRELDILELLAQRYRNKEIAAKLFISSHTVNYHLKHIYQKLGVTSRRQAVAKAMEEGFVVADR